MPIGVKMEGNILRAVATKFGEVIPYKKTTNFCIASSLEFVFKYANEALPCEV